jgi:Tol biopolymer transport system component
MSATASPSITSSPAAIAPEVHAPWIVFGVRAASGDHRYALWAMRSDGSGSHEILIAGYFTVAWSHDGSRLLLNDGSIHVAEVDEDIGPFVDTGIDVPQDSQWEAFDFAPDGERVVYVDRSKCAKNGPALGVAPSGVELAMLVAETAGANCWTLGILDLRSGERTRLGKTLVKDQVRDQNLALELPAWSPDGTKIAYTRLDQATDRRELWVVNADGTAPSRIELSADVSLREPRWSPDGTRISLTSVTWPSVDTSEWSVYVADLVSGGLERITTGSSPAAGELCCADWLDNTHLRVQGTAPTDMKRFWSVALDVIPHESELLVDLTESFATDAPGPAITRSAPGDPGRTLYWQPLHDGPG